MTTSHAAADELLDLLALGDDPDLDTVLGRILRTARTLARARYAAIGVPDGRGGFARFVTAGIDAKRAAQIGELPRTHGVLGALLDSGPIRLADIRKHPRFSYFPRHHPVMTDFLGVPIAHRGEVIGNLFVSGSRAGRFSVRDQRALEGLATYAGVAIANADLFARAQRLAVIEERTRVARELHDAATQTLFGLVLAARASALSSSDASTKQQFDVFEQRAASALQELRGLVYALRPKSLERDGLAATLADHAETLARGGTDITVDADEGIRLPLDTEHALLRIGQEAINNAVRHASGSPVRVSLHREGRAVVLRVSDEGSGIVASDSDTTRRGLGMSTMRERAAEVGATLSVDSAPGRGTTVSARVVDA